MRPPSHSQKVLKRYIFTYGFKYIDQSERVGKTLKKTKNEQDRQLM